MQEDEQQFLQQTLERPLTDFGVPTTIWSIRDLQALLRRERQPEVSVDTIHRVLHAMGYRYRRPRHDLSHRQDPDAVASAQQVLQWLEKSRVAEERVRLVFVDECEIHTHPRLAKVWQRRGRPMKVPAAGADRKFVVFGALDYASGRIFWQVSPQKNSEEFARFLTTLTQAFPEEMVVLVLDNVGYHKSHALAQSHRACLALAQIQVGLSSVVECHGPVRSGDQDPP